MSLDLCQDTGGGAVMEEEGPLFARLQNGEMGALSCRWCPRSSWHGPRGAIGARERPAVGHVLLATVPTPPLRRGHCGYFPDEAVDS